MDVVQKNYIVTIQGTHKIERLKENYGASEIFLSAEEIKALDDALDNMKMSAVYGGATIK